MADLLARPEGESAQIVATYDNVDEQGLLLYQVCRFSPKGFRQRRPDGAGGWIWNVERTRRVLFGLPQLRGQTVAFIVEGEKDVLTLLNVDLVATTNAGGAGRWREEYTRQLREAGVRSLIILPDHDGPGRDHAVAAARSCHAASLMVRVVELAGLAPKGDVSDWLAAGHTRAELLALVDAAEPYEPSAPAVVPSTADTAGTSKPRPVIVCLGRRAAGAGDVDLARPARRR
jgi:hypothetical protein